MLPFSKLIKYYFACFIVDHEDKQNGKDILILTFAGQFVINSKFLININSIKSNQTESLRLDSLKAKIRLNTLHNWWRNKRSNQS